jgi:hypothetical protein
MRGQNVRARFTAATNKNPATETQERRSNDKYRSERCSDLRRELINALENIHRGGRAKYLIFGSSEELASLITGWLEVRVFPVSLPQTQDG